MSDKNIVLNVNGIEVIYNHVILVLKGVSLQVPEQGIVAILGGNGAGKTTTLQLQPAAFAAGCSPIRTGNPQGCGVSAFSRQRTCRPTISRAA